MVKRLAMAVGLAAALAGCSSSSSSDAAAASKGPAASKNDAPIRVGTYNIRLSGGAPKFADHGTPNMWEARKEDLVALLRRLDLDVFGLQEVCPAQAAYLRAKMPDYKFVGEHRNADRRSGEASPVCYRASRFEALKSGTFWLSETPDVPGLKGWGAACPRVCSYLVLRDRRSGLSFCFANTHTDHVSALAREKGMLLIVSRMKEFGAGCPIVFTGDHNCRETEPPSQAVSKILVNAIYASETPPTGPWRTFNGWGWRDREYPAVAAMKLPENVRNARKGSPDANKDKNGGHVWEDCGARIDYIYVSPGVRVRDYATFADPRPGKKLYPSDHFPIVATIDLQAKNEVPK
ncbi:MAG: endonuclease/exonuclease/phosphatase family protein [Kiritimatiellae bacterium]|nr:endonuclease/exonuclease/phosphatase family protein [Kiritimatiellia bacterium]